MRLRHIASLPGGYATELSFAPDGKTWACSRTGLIQLWTGARLIHEIEMPGHAIGPVRFAENGELLLAGPFLVTVADGCVQPLPSFLDRLGFGIDAGPLGPAQMAPENSMFTPDTSVLMVYARYRPEPVNKSNYYRGPHERLVLLEGRTRKPLALLWEGDGLLNCRVLDATTTHLAAAGMGARLWSLEPLRLQGEYPAERLQVNALRFSNDGLQLAYGNAAGNVTVRQVADGSSRHWLADPAGIASLCFTSNGERILTGGMDGALTFWSNQGEPALVASHRFPAAVESLALSPADNFLLAALGGRLQDIELYEIDAHGAS